MNSKYERPGLKVNRSTWKNCRRQQNLMRRDNICTMNLSRDIVDIAVDISLIEARFFARTKTMNDSIS